MANKATLPNLDEVLGIDREGATIGIRKVNPRPEGGVCLSLDDGRYMNIFFDLEDGVHRIEVISYENGGMRVEGFVL